jgi:hypothetical protein
MTFGSWEPHLPGEFSQRTPIAALSATPGRVDLFAVAEDGLLYTMWWRDGRWRGWVRLRVTKQIFSQRTRIAAVSAGLGSIDLIGVAADGGPYNASLRPSDFWRCWRGWDRIAVGQFTPSTPVTAAISVPGLLDLFAVGEDGVVYTASRLLAAAWQGWTPVPVAGRTFAQGTEVAAATAQVGLLSLFAVSVDGGAYTAWRDGDTPWQGWTRIGDGQFSPGTPIAAVSVQSGWIDLFAVGEDGGIYTAWWRGGAWQGWNGPVGQGVFDQFTPITAVSATPGGIDLFAVGEDGGAYQAAHRSDTSWSEWSRIAEGEFARLTPITALVSNQQTSVGLYAIGKGPGNLYTTWSPTGELDQPDNPNPSDPDPGVPLIG